MSQPASAISRLQTHSSVTVENDSVAVIYSNRLAAETAILALDRSGFDMRKLSVIGKDYTTEEVVVGFLNPGDRMDVWARTGAFWGKLTGALFGAALLVIPGFGPLFAAGPLVGRIVHGLDGKVINDGMSALAAGLYSIGIPKNSIVSFETQLKSGKFIVIAHASPSEVEGSGIFPAATEHPKEKAHERSE